MKRASGRRELIDTGRNKMYGRRDEQGRFTEMDDVSRSLSTDPKLVGITMPFSFQFFEALKFAKLLKDKAPHVKIVVGGLVPPFIS